VNAMVGTHKKLYAALCPRSFCIATYSFLMSLISRARAVLGLAIHRHEVPRVEVISLLACCTMAVGTPRRRC